jgi:hypothetical protein
MYVYIWMFYRAPKVRLESSKLSVAVPFCPLVQKTVRVQKTLHPQVPNLNQLLLEVGLTVRHTAEATPPKLHNFSLTVLAILTKRVLFVSVWSMTLHLSLLLTRTALARISPCAKIFQRKYLM